MGRRRISVRPRSCSERRILARKGLRVDGFVNSVKGLHRWEISSKGDRGFSLSNAHERFRNFRPQISVRNSIDIIPRNTCPSCLVWRKRSKIV